MSEPAKSPGVVLSRVPKSGSAEVRITSSTYKHRPIVDFRLWWVPKGQTETVSSSKGFTIDAQKMPELLAQLREHFP